MRVLVYPHDLAIGGSQINAIDLAASVAAAGHDVFVYGAPGPLADYVRERGLRFLAAREARHRPAPARILQIARIAARERIDLIHCYEWPPCLDAYFGAGLWLGTPVLSTVLSMEVPAFVPTSAPLIMGTERLGREARKLGRDGVWVIEPPIDVTRDTPGIDGAPFRKDNGVGASDLLVVTVSRLAIDLKLDALVRAIDAVELLADRYPVKLVLVGDGPARAALTERAERINSRVGRQVISLPGAVADPRAAYAAADVVVGMGSSALRALSIGSPLVVQGERGFSEIFEPATCALFLEQGFYGLADDQTGADRLASQIGQLLSNAQRRRELGVFGRDFVVERFSLERAAKLQIEIYRQVLEARPRARFIHAMQSAALALGLEIANHDPRVKRQKARRELHLLDGAASGVWPPQRSLA